MKFFYLVFFSLLSSVFAQKNIGDPNRVFDTTKTINIDSTLFLDTQISFKQKQQRWAKAGVQGGVRITGKNSITLSPFIFSQKDASKNLQKAIDKIAKKGGGTIHLKKGLYVLKNNITLYNNITLKGAGTEKTVIKLKIPTQKKYAFLFKNLTNKNTTSGIRDLRIEGDITSNPDPALMKNTNSKYNINTIGIVRSKNCYVDNVVIINSFNSPISTWAGSHHTFRNISIKGCWNKGKGGTGYFALQSSDCLVYQCNIRGIRHFTLQREYCEYNVVYNNDIQIDINFHNADKGNNLIENNKLTLPAYLGNLQKTRGTRYNVMGPWSVKHAPTIKNKQNFIYNNSVQNLAFPKNKHRCNNLNKLYFGANLYEPGVHVSDSKKGNPFYQNIIIGANKTIYATTSR